MQNNVASDLWVKWNCYLVSIWKHNKVVMYADPKIDMIVWANTEKFALWDPYLTAPKIQQRREKSGDAESTALPSRPLASPSQQTTDRQGPSGAENPKLHTDSIIPRFSLCLTLLPSRPHLRILLRLWVLTGRALEMKLMTNLINSIHLIHLLWLWLLLLRLWLLLFLR